MRVCRRSSVLASAGLAIFLGAGSLCGAAGDQTSSHVAAETAEHRAACSAWGLASKAVEMAAELDAVAIDGVRWADELLSDCNARPVCEHSRERRLFDDGVAEARKHQAKIAGLRRAAEMRERELREQLRRRAGDPETACEGL
jgi:hypothetical protein